jgi:hypothetical protein
MDLGGLFLVELLAGVSLVAEIVKVSAAKTLRNIEYVLLFQDGVREGRYLRVVELHLV